MNIYEDYQNYIAQQQAVINQLEKTESPILAVFEDIKAVLDYTSKLAAENSKIDEDLQEAFDVGFQYMMNVIADLRTYYDEYFKSNIDRLNYYAPLIVYTISLDDYLGYLRDEEILSDEMNHLIDDIQNQIDEIMVKNEVFDVKLLDQFDTKITELTSPRDRFNPITSIFSRIREILDIF